MHISPEPHSRPSMPLRPWPLRGKRNDARRPKSGEPSISPTLQSQDVIFLIIGVVVGAGIFALPSLVAANVSSVPQFIAAWALGGCVSLIGAWCYAELSTTYPNAGGDYHYLRRAFGHIPSFLFAWARLAVLQTGSIAIQAYIIGDYLTRYVSLGAYSSALYAAAIVCAVTGVNILGVTHSKGTQAILSIATTFAVLAIALTGLLGPPAEGAIFASAPASPPGHPAFGLAMVFVLLAYGGWNEAVYMSAELKDARRKMTRALVSGIGAVTLLYLLINLAYVRGLGLSGVAASKTVAADLLHSVAGPEAAIFITIFIAIAVLSTMNATIITGARTSYALGQDVPSFQWLGQWDEKRGTPANALVLQGVITLILIGLGAVTRQGFVSMVEYTAPVFWLFFFLTGISLVVLRTTEPNQERPFKVPLYPITPAIFCAVCVYMTYASLVHTGLGALAGVAVLLAGIPVLLFTSTRSAVQSQLLRTEHTA